MGGERKQEVEEAKEVEGVKEKTAAIGSVDLCGAQYAAARHQQLCGRDVPAVGGPQRLKRCAFETSESALGGATKVARGHENQTSSASGLLRHEVPGRAKRGRRPSNRNRSVVHRMMHAVHGVHGGALAGAIAFP
jgi:hypothetical protein